jgi:hypothetical protein
MSAQWFNPMTDTPEGLLLGDVQYLLKSILEKKKKEKKDKQYKSDRGQRTPPEMPTPKGNTNKIDKTTEILQEMGIIVKSNCSKCGMPYSEHDYNNPNMCQETSGVSKSDEKTQFSCDQCKSTEVSGVDRNGLCYKCRSGNPPKKPEVIDVPKHMMRGMVRDRKGNLKPASESEVKKYYQEPSVDDLFPHFENVDGGVPVRAHGFSTNQTYPATNDGPSKSIISEKAKIPSYAQKGYTAKSSSLHMHYNDAGGTRKNPPNIDLIEQRLASLTKHAGRNNLGMIGEIEGLLKQVKDLIESPSN